MLGELSHDEIETILSTELLGRIGCSANGVTYIVPVTYAYDAGHIYAYSQEGMKIQMMRQNPIVCFEVDKMVNMSNWQSVIAWGRFEELKNADQKMGIQKLMSRFKSEKTSETSLPARDVDDPQQSYSSYKPVVYRIKLLEKSGRFEKR